MPRISGGLKTKERAKFLLEALLAFVNQELTDSSGVKIKANWQGKTADLFVKTRLKDLENLTAKYKNNSQLLTKEQTREVLKHLAEFLHILEDKQEKKQGKLEFKFLLKLWSRDKKRNLEIFDQKWEERKSKSSNEKQTKENLISQIMAAEYLNPKALIGFGITNEKAAEMVGVSLRQFYRYEHKQPPEAIRKFGATLARQLISEGKKLQPDLVYIIVRHLESEQC